MPFSSFKDLILPCTCLFCGKGKDYICHNCFTRNLLKPEITTINFIPTLSMSRYQDLVREIIVRHKDHHFVGIRKYLSYSMALGLKLMDLPTNCLVVSIPTDQKQIRNRLDDPVRYLVTDAAKQAGYKYSNQVIYLKHGKKDQVGLSYVERLENMKNIFKVRGKGAAVVVCDDVLTTGATFQSATGALIQAGYQVIANICVANTPKPGTGKSFQ